MTACGERNTPVEPTAGGESEISAGEVAPPRYSAREFFETTTYAMAAPSGYAFTVAGDQLLVSSDVSGVFNAYAMPVAGGTPQPLTASEVDAVFGLSWFPADEADVVHQGRGGQ